MKKMMNWFGATTVFCLLMVGNVAATNVDATNRPPVQTFYVPLPEADVLQALQTIHGGAGWVVPSEPVRSYLSIAVFVDKTVIYYDQHEDGYEIDLANPNHLYSSTNLSGTQIWGDGDPSNGYPPNYPNDVLYAGNIITLKSDVKVAYRENSEIYWDGADKFGSTKPIAVTRAAWASASETLFAGANEVYDTTYFGDSFVCPVGIDTENQNEVFQYTGLSIMAGPEGATVTVGDSEPVTLTEGEACLVDGGVKQGTKITATAGSVQVELLTGDIYDGFESRFIKLLPTRLWSSSYTSPVATPLNTEKDRTYTTSGTKIWLYNPNSTALKVNYMTSALTEKSITVPALGTTYVIPYSGKGSEYTGRQSGTYFYTSDKQPFYALATVDATGTTQSTLRQLGGSNRTWDWGFALIPDDSLSSQVVVGLGIGRDPTSSVNPDENDAPVWVTSPFKATTVYVDYDGNLATGSKTDAAGHKCDEIISLDRLEISRIYNSEKGDQTGMLIYTLDKDAKLAAAWGEDPETATAGAPGLDMGTGIPPMPEYFMQKSSKLATDMDGDGYITPGDTLEYSIQILNVGRLPITDLKLSDVLPANAVYVAGSTKYESNSGKKLNIADNSEGDAFPLSGAGLNLALAANSETVLDVGGIWTYSYRVTVQASDTLDKIMNLAVVNGLGTVISNSVSDPLRSRVGDRVWVDLNENGVQDASEPGMGGVTVSLLDTDGNVVRDDHDNPYTATTDENGAYLFIGVCPGTYRVSFTIPSAYVATAKDAGSDDTVDSDVNENGATDEFTLKGGIFDLTRDAGLKPNPDAASVAITKLAGDAADGETLTVNQNTSVTYTYTVRNTGLTYLKNLVVTDDKLGAIGTIAGPLAPAGLATLTKTITAAASVTNVATVVAYPSDSEGNDLPGFDNSVSNTDDAVVEIIITDLPGSIGDYVWDDLNTNGLQDAGEMGLYGITVNLLKDGAVVATTKTDASGKYLFTGVMPGTYSVQFVANGWSFTTANAGDDSLDSDADADGVAAGIELTSGGEILTVDAGLLHGVPQGICDWLSLANKFNAFILGNLTTVGGDSEGNLLIGGNAAFGVGYSVGLIGPGYGRTRDASSLGTDALVVAGDLSEASAPDINGNIVYGGSYTNKTVAKRLNTSYDVRHVTPVTLDAVFNVPEDGSGTTISALAARIRAFSAVLASLPQSASVVYDTETEAPNATWKGTETWRNVFNVTVDQFNQSGSGITLDVPAASKVLVNVWGAAPAVSNASINLPSGMSPRQVVFNFVDATNLTAYGFEFPGTVLAPNAATATLTGASIDGFAFFGGNVAAYNGFEFHDYAFEAFDCSASPVVTNKPGLTVALTVNSSVAGEITRALEGSALTIKQTISNTGRTSLKNVQFTDVNGAVYEIGTLAVGESTYLTATATLAADVVFTASATATPCRADGTAVDGYASPVRGSGSAKAEVATQAELTAIAEAKAAAKGYVPRPDFEVTAMSFLEKPTITGELFSVSVTVKNVGEVAGVPGSIAMFISHADVVTNGTPDVVKNDYRSLPVGSEMTYAFYNLTAPATRGIHHARAVVDFGNATGELSEGNNQLPLSYWLNPIDVQILLQGTTLTLLWNSEEGQTYTIRGSDDMTTWNDLNDEACQGIAATVPTNSVSIDMTVQTNKFFKLSVDAIDTSDIK